MSGAQCSARLWLHWERVAQQLALQQLQAGSCWMTAQEAAAVCWVHRPLYQSQYQGERQAIVGNDLDGLSMPQGLLLPVLQEDGMTAAWLMAGS
jgi:hypothetical protein